MDDSIEFDKHQEFETNDDLDVTERFDSVALQRLIDEVSNRGGSTPDTSTVYNRTYHRHNR